MQHRQPCGRSLSGRIAAVEAIKSFNVYIIIYGRSQKDWLSGYGFIFHKSTTDTHS